MFVFPADTSRVAHFAEKISIQATIPLILWFALRKMRRLLTGDGLNVNVNEHELLTVYVRL
jgi:hypothetical protein